MRLKERECVLREICVSKEMDKEVKGNRWRDGLELEAKTLIDKGIYYKNESSGIEKAKQGRR